MTTIRGKPRSNDRVDLNRAFTALSDPVRRRILVELRTDSPITMDEFVTDGFTPPGPGGRTVAIELHHSHLPQLRKAGFVDWDRGMDRIRRGEHFEEILPLLDLLCDNPDELPGEWP